MSPLEMENAILSSCKSLHSKTSVQNIKLLNQQTQIIMFSCSTPIGILKEFSLKIRY